MLDPLKVSIHAPARGAMFEGAFMNSQSSFNSRTREGCDPRSSPKLGGGSVSIHAPARGAMSCALILGTYWRFQFTHPRGVRSTRNAHKVGAQGFNSRTREGCDRALFDEVHRQWVSIHAPVRGAMRIWSKSRFNSRTREGCDIQQEGATQTYLFQFTHP